MDKKSVPVVYTPGTIPPPVAGITANGWNEYSRLVLTELERLNDNYESLRNGIVEIKVDIAKLQVKSGVWGLVGGGVSVLVTILVLLVKSGTLIP